MPALLLRRGKERSLQRRHPWLYAGGVERVLGHPEAGQTLRLLSADGDFLAWAAYSPSSQIRARAWSFDESDRIDADWIGQRVAQAVARRAPLAARSNALRLVFGEADLLPGLIVDRYADQLVLQFTAAGVDRWREAIVDALVAATGCRDIYERSDAASREREGLAPREGVLRGQAPAGPVPVVEDGVRYGVDVQRGHKTGFYIDQRDNRAQVAAAAAGRSVLNCFCYTGGFTLAALRGGAREALSIDSSADALAQARQQQQANGLSAACEWREANVFDALKQLLAEGRRFDLIVLDPPKFAPSVKHVEKAARAYKEINLKALRLLTSGGLLFTFSCSGAISVDMFQKIVAGAVFDAGVDAQMLARLQAGEDHPMLMTHPEGEYLKGLKVLRL
ncbi:MAG: class I SAM-dependent rRNA methyltransferase [Burkholderiaceae bacterium]